MKNIRAIDWRWSSPQRWLLKIKQGLHWRQTPLVGFVSYLRWTIPIAVSFVGVVYILLEDLIFQGHALSEVSVVRSVLVIGLAGPALVWITLTWAARAAMAEAEAQKELARRNHEARLRAARLQTASLIGQRMTAILDLNTLLAQVVRLISTKLGYYHVHLFLIDEDSKQIVLKEAYGLHADLIRERGLRFEIGKQGIIGAVAQSGQILACNDVRLDSRYDPSELLPETQAELAVPLQVGKRIVGVLDVQSDYCNAFNQEDVIVLQILGNQIGIAIENARLFEETKRRYQAMTALHEVSLDMIGQLDMAAFLEALLRRGTNLLGAQAGSLYLYDEQSELVRNIASYNTWRDWTGVVLRPGEGMCGHIILTGEPLIVNDYESWPGKSGIFAGGPQTRAVGVPIQHGSKTIGAILILNDAQARSFDRDDMWLLQQISDLAAIGIENAKLHTQIKNFSREMEHQVDERTRELSSAKEEIAIKAAQLRSLLSKTITIQEEERARIARDLHDSVVQLITAARYEIKAAKVVGSSELSPLACGKLDAARQVLEEAEKELHNAVYDLHSPILEVAGLVPALQNYLNRVQELWGIRCSMAVNGAARRLKKAVEIAVFRIVEEAMQNVIEHSEATLASVYIAFDSVELKVTLQDNGQGFAYRQWVQNQMGNHLGLVAMQERVTNLGGDMSIWSEPGSGTRIQFRLPIQDEGIG